MDFSHLTVPKLREALKQAGVEVKIISCEKKFVQSILSQAPSKAKKSVLVALLNDGM